jgi:hypothetical protein
VSGYLQGPRQLNVGDKIIALLPITTLPLREEMSQFFFGGGCVPDSHDDAWGLAGHEDGWGPRSHRYGWGVIPRHGWDAPVTSAEARFLPLASHELETYTALTGTHTQPNRLYRTLQTTLVVTLFFLVIFIVTKRGQIILSLTGQKRAPPVQRCKKTSLAKNGVRHTQ